MHSLQGSRWVRLILGTMAVAACTREAPNREGEAKGGAIVPSRFTQLTVAQHRLWVTTDVGIVVIEPVAEKWMLLDLGSQRIVPTSVVSCGSDIWLRLEDSLALLDLKTRSLRISAPTRVTRESRRSAHCGAPSFSASVRMLRNLMTRKGRPLSPTRSCL